MEEFFKPKDWNGEFDPEGSICCEINNKGKKTSNHSAALLLLLLHHKPSSTRNHQRAKDILSIFKRVLFAYLILIGGYW